MKKLVPIILLISIFLFVACSPEPTYPTELNPQKLSDSRFNGHFVYSYYWEDSEGIEEKNEYYSYRFDGTNKCWYYSYYKNYYKDIGWIYSGDYIGDAYSTYYEVEVNGSKNAFRTRLWDNEYSTWSDWKEYKFVDSNTLRIYSSPTIYKDYIKQ